MSQPPSSRADSSNASTLMNLVSGTLATIVMAGAVLISEFHPAFAQDAVVARRMDDSGGHSIEGGHMFVMPAFSNRFDALLRPEFSRRDVQLCHEHFNLAEEQMYVLQVLLDGYTEQFQAAADEFRSVQSRYRLKIPGMDGAMFGGEMPPPDMLGAIGEMVQVGEGGEGGDVLQLGDMEFVMASPGSVQISVTQDVNVTSTDGGEPQVAVAFVATDESGESILTEEEIQQITERISEQIKERMAEVESRKAELQAKREAAEAAGGDEGAIQAEEVPSTAEEVADAGAKMIAERNRLREEFVTDVNMLLNEEQKDTWAAFERKHRRVNTMRFSEFSGERVDVIRVLNELQPTIADQGSLNAAREQYELDLEAALKTRNTLLPEHEIATLLATEEMIASGTMDDEERLDLMDRVADSRAAVRDANLLAAKTIEPLIAEEDRAEFREAVNREAFPQIYSSTLTQRSLEAALKVEDLDDETRTALTALAADYNAQVAAFNERMVAQTLEDEPRQHRRLIETMDKIHEMEVNADEPGKIDFSALENDRGFQLMEERSNLGRKTLAQVRTMLTEEQLAQLPKARRAMPFFGEGGGPPPGGAAGVRVIRTQEGPPPPPPAETPPPPAKAPPPPPPAGE